MNKKIKVIELLSEISKGENPTFRKHGGDYKNSVWTFINSYFDKKMTHEEIVDWLNSEVEILEDEEEIDIQNMGDLPIDSNIHFYDNYSIRANRVKINELVRAVKQLNKKINKEE